MSLLLLVEKLSSVSSVPLESVSKENNVCSKCWCVNSVAEMRTEISASKLEHVRPQASLKSEEVPSGNLKWTPKPANVVPLNADPSV